MADLEVGKWYRGKGPPLTGVHFKIVKINDNGTVEIETASYHRRMVFKTMELKEEMKVEELT
jgi:hypothetical protein